MMSLSSSTSGNDEPVGLTLDVVLDTSCNIFDLSGKTPFVFHVHVSRRVSGISVNHESRRLPVDIITNGSLLDVASALKVGMLTLVEVSDEPERTRLEVSRDSFSDICNDASSSPSTPPLCSVRLLPAFNRNDPQIIECRLDQSISSALKDGTVYRLSYCKEAFQDKKFWNGGIAWWKQCTSVNQPIELSAPTDTPEARLRRRPMPLFKAMMNPRRPPKIEYELEVSPATISLTDFDTINISVRFRLCESKPYTVMWCKKTPVVQGNAFGTQDIGSFTFDIADVSTGEILSRTPQYGTYLYSPKLPQNTSIQQEDLRELQPNETYTTQREIRGSENGRERFLKYFRIKDSSTLLDRSLGLKLRAVDTFWAASGIDDLFEHEDTIKRDYWYIPLTIRSPATVGFSVTP